MRPAGTYPFNYHPYFPALFWVVLVTKFLQLLLWDSHDAKFFGPPKGTSELEYILKFVTLIVICGANFPNFSPIDVFSFEMDSLNNEDNFVDQVIGLADI